LIPKQEIQNVEHPRHKIQYWQSAGKYFAVYLEVENIAKFNGQQKINNQKNRQEIE